MNCLLRFSSLLVGLLFLFPQGTHGWGIVGHEMVANIAWYRLSNETKAWVSSVLGNVNTKQAGSPLAAVSTWADQVRYTKLYHWSTPLHYVDVQDDIIDGGCPVVAPGVLTNCRFNYTRDCVDDFCAAGAITNYSTRLDTQAPHANESLKFLTHILGDIHQPLHSSRKTDKGGNTIQVNFDLPPPRGLMINRDGMVAAHHGWNLHAIWDDGIIEKAMNDFYNNERTQFEQALIGTIEDYANSGQLTLWLACGDGRSKACTSVWAEESFGTALSFAYREVDGQEIRNSSTISEEYYISRLDVVKRRVVAAGVRLAWTLELIVKESESKPTSSPNTYLRPISNTKAVLF